MHGSVSMENYTVSLDSIEYGEPLGKEEEKKYLFFCDLLHPYPHGSFCPGH